MAKIVLIFESRQAISGSNEQVFIEAHDESGKSIDVGEWAADGDYETLTIDCVKFVKPSEMGGSPGVVYAGQSNTAK